MQDFVSVFWEVK